MREVCEFLKKSRVYYLATTDGDRPRVRPFGTVNIFEGKLYIQTGKNKKVSEQIAANPKVEISAMISEHEWIRVAATLVEDDRLEPQRSMLDAYPELQSMYRPGDGNTQVFYLKDAEAVFSDFAKEPRVVHF